MQLKVYIPPDKDLPYDSIRLAAATTAEKRIVTTPPFGRPVIIFCINPDSFKDYNATSEGVILGQHTQPMMLNLSQDFKVMAIHLKPYGLKQLLNIDASQLTNKYISFKGIPWVEELYKLVITNMNDDSNLITEFNHFMMNMKSHPVSFEVNAFLNHIIKAEHVESVSEIAKEAGFTERNLERKFKTEVGISPKKFIQIRRVFRVYETLKTNTDWQQLVMNYNYTDQAHLINEFKKYASIAPGLYVRKRMTFSDQHPTISDFAL